MSWTNYSTSNFNDVMTFYTQTGFDIRFEWGSHGIDALSKHAAVTIIVDVLSFATCVDIATARGASIFPYQWRDDSAAAFARQHDAHLAEPRNASGYTLSPASLENIPAATRLVLPSPNGATLTLLAQRHCHHVLAGCLRNANAVANYAAASGGSVAVIAAGERWANGDLRPALEDAVGAGAIIHMLPGTRSPEAAAVEATFLSLSSDISTMLSNCTSGQELSERGFERDIELAAMMNCSDAVPMLTQGAYINAATLPSIP